MKKQFKFIALAMAAAASIVACSKSDDSSSDGNGGDTSADTTFTVLADSTTINDAIKVNTTLSANGNYFLEGIVKVEDGVTLKIEEGVTLTAIESNNVGYILVKQGGKIDAQGTASKPIVMTSEDKTPGAWGGVHICGKAPINSGVPSVSEIGSEYYGGTDAADNSGIMKYVRLEYTGYSYSEDQECNGISFYGVGNGTTISYVQAYRGTDDGFEFFGGTVNIDHAVVTSCSDDSFDWTDGWVGCGQFLVVSQEDKAVSTLTTDCFLECDNGKPSDASPMSHPTLSNLTMISYNGDSKKDGVMLKAGTQVSLYNAIATGKKYGVSISEGDDAYTHYVDGLSTIKGFVMDTDSVYLKGSDSEGNTVYSASTAATEKFVADGNKLSAEFAVAGNVVTVTDAPAFVAVPEVSNSNFTFEVVDYVGAIKDADSDWTQGWTLAYELN